MLAKDGCGDCVAVKTKSLLSDGRVPEALENVLPVKVGRQVIVSASQIEER